LNRSSKKRSTGSTTSKRKPRSLEAITPRRARPEPDDEDDDVPALELPGKKRRDNDEPAPFNRPVPEGAFSDQVEQALHAIEWARSRGVSLNMVTIGGVTLGIQAMGGTRSVTATDREASSQLYRQYAGAAIARELGATDEDDEE
jgi:hypothetical protein